MNAHTKAAREQYRTFAARPGMFVIDSYDDVASFIAGMDYAHNDELLKGFQEWLQQRFGSKSPLVWSEDIKRAFERLSDDDKRMFGEDRKRFLFANIEEFFREMDA